MFTTTVNTLNIPPPFMDGMEIIRITGDTEHEKVDITRKRLTRRAIAKRGLDSSEWAIDDEALLLLIRRSPRNRACASSNANSRRSQGSEGADTVEAGPSARSSSSTGRQSLDPVTSARVEPATIPMARALPRHCGSARGFASTSYCCASVATMGCQIRHRC